MTEKVTAQLAQLGQDTSKAFIELRYRLLVSITSKNSGSGVKCPQSKKRVCFFMDDVLIQQVIKNNAYLGLGTPKLRLTKVLVFFVVLLNLLIGHFNL